MRTRTVIGTLVCVLLMLFAWGERGWCGESGSAAAAPVSEGGANAEPDSARTASADSTAAGEALPSRISEADSVVVDPFIPVWKSFMNANETSVGLGSEMKVSSLPGYDWIMNSSIRVEKKSYRGRNMEDVNEMLTHNATKLQLGRYRIMATMGESYTKKKTLGLARYGKDLIYDSKSAMVDAVYTKPILGASSSQLAVKGDVRMGRQDFKYDKTYSGGVSGLFTYGFGDLLKVKAGGGLLHKRETSEIGSIAFAGMPSRGDTLRVGAEYGAGTKKLMIVSYERATGVERRAALPRGNSLEILDNPELVQEEEAHLNSEDLKIISHVRPFQFLSVDIDFKHGLTSQKHKVDTRLSKEGEDTSLKATTSYTYSKSGILSLAVSTNERSDDYGPLSLSSFTEKEKKVTMRLKQDVTDSLSVTMSGYASLKQRFFKKQDANPRDADYLYYKLEGKVNSIPLPGMKAYITGVITRNETINIDKTLSDDNRIDYMYRLGPMIQLNPTAWLDLSQEYSIKIEYTDFVYKEDENYLDRTTTMITNANIMILRPLRFSFKHVYLMRDSGSYLLRDGIRKYNMDGETLENGLFLKALYRPIIDLDIIAEVDFKIQENNRLGFQGGEQVVTSSRGYDSGGLKVGLLRKSSFWENGKINLDINYVKRFGPYISAERQAYWVVNSSIDYTF